MKLIRDFIRRIVIIPAMGMACTAFGAESSSAGTASNVETRTFKLTYASAVIGGLSRTEEQEVEDGIPYLRDIPWIGQFLFGSKTTRKNKVDIVLFVTVGEIDAEGPRGAVGAPAGAMNVVHGYPRGFNETNEHERSQSNER